MSVRVEKQQDDAGIPATELPEGGWGFYDVGGGAPMIVRKLSNGIASINTVGCWPLEGRFVRPIPLGTHLVVTERGVALEEHEMDGTIPASEMREGQIAEVVRSPIELQVGCVMCRVDSNTFLALCNRCTWHLADVGEDRVRPLPNGTRLVVEGNE